MSLDTGYRGLPPSVDAIMPGLLRPHLYTAIPGQGDKSPWPEPGKTQWGVFNDTPAFRELLPACLEKLNEAGFQAGIVAENGVVAIQY